MKRTVKEICESAKNCKPGEMPVEIVDLAYKMRNEQPLNTEEIELRDAWFTHLGWGYL